MSLWLYILDLIVSILVNVGRYSIKVVPTTLLSYIVITIISSFVDYGKTMVLSLTTFLT